MWKWSIFHFSGTFELTLNGIPNVFKNSSLRSNHPLKKSSYSLSNIGVDLMGLVDGLA